MGQYPAIGVYEHQSVVGPYEPTLAALDQRLLRNGLGTQICYLYGGWREADGTLHVFERKFMGPMTAGLWLMRVEDGQVKIDPSSIRTSRGESKRSFSDDEIVWRGQMMENQAGEDEEGMVLRFVEGGFDWTEGKVLRLHGELRGPGLQIHAPDQHEPFFYMSQLYKVRGEVLGAEVEGFVFVDHTGWPHGADWKEWKVFNHLQLAWVAFANEFEDGSIEWGHLCLGADRFSFTMTANDSGPTALHTVGVHGGVDFGDNDYNTRTLWRCGDDAWIFELEPGGQLKEFTEARWGTYRAQCGYVSRPDERRPLKVGFAWNETFADRIKANGIPPVADALKA